MSPRRRIALGALAIAAGFALWLPALHRCFGWGSRSLAKADKLATRQLEMWTDPAQLQAELARMRGTNAEWDFMSRSFLCWSLANLALAHPERKAAALEVIDRLIVETEKLERERGPTFFLMDYARAKPWVMQPVRSQFLDGELALTVALRDLVEPRPADRAPLLARVEAMTARMERSPTLSAESYPDECWTFCNAVALAALRATDQVYGTDHSDLLRRWVEGAKAKLVDPRTGLLISTYTLEGRVLQGPEGSSIWLAAHMLQIVDPAFARDQFDRARRELGIDLLGFGFSREWPRGEEDRIDVDSGLVIPWLGASPGASGLALVGAAGFGDQAFLEELHASLDFAGMPEESARTLRYHASNPVGDAVLLYSTALGPAWGALGAKP